MIGVTFFRLKFISCFLFKDSQSDSKKFRNINSDSCLYSEIFKVTYINRAIHLSVPWVLQWTEKKQNGKTKQRQA